MRVDLVTRAEVFGREAWLADNGEAIAASNARVEARGVFSDDWRTF